MVLYLVPTIYRFKYYFAWGVAESGLTLSGFNYNGQNDRGVFLWDRYVNARIRHVEGQTSLAKLPEHWNVCTGLFLRQCKVHVKLSNTLQLLLMLKSILSFSRCRTVLFQAVNHVACAFVYDLCYLYDVLQITAQHHLNAGAVLRLVMTL